MALTQFSGSPLTDMVESLATAPALTVVAGAGVSAEAGLPPWRRLLRDLLERVAESRLGLSDAGVRAAWIDQILKTESAPGAAAVAHALAGPDLERWIPDALYAGDPLAYQPGPIARQIAELRRAFGSGLNLLTTNYDDLVEQAILDAKLGVAPVAWVGPSGPARPATDAAHQRVVHLHGYLGRDGHAEGDVVLTEEDYQRVAQVDWQSSEVGHALMHMPCVFIGSSLSDPNLLRYLHTHTGPGANRHCAIFTRQDAYPQGVDAEVILARETALRSRWAASKLDIIFVDHYAEIAQLLGEVAMAKAEPRAYQPLPTRLAAWRQRIDEELLVPGDREAFPKAQDALHEALRDALGTAVETIARLGHDPGEEVLAATLWLVDGAGTALTSWAFTDRVHRDPNTIEPVEIDEHSRWVAVRAYTRGAALGEPRDVYASRWRYIRGLPLVAQSKLPVGVVTIASMRPEAETILTALPAPVEAAFDDALRRAALDILGGVSSAK